MSKRPAAKKPKPMNAFYAQSGGVSAVINASAAGVIEAAMKSKHIDKVYAGRHGIVGALTEDLIDCSKESRATIKGLRYTPAGAFGSARYKLKSLEQDRAKYERLIEVFKAHDIGYFFYNGGNDSMDTANKVSQIGDQLGHRVICVGVPKTVDNDLPHTDCTPGFGSVAKYVAMSTREAALDVASMAKTSTKVFVMEVMGRHAGWIVSAAGLAGKGPDAGAAHHPVSRDRLRQGKVPREGEAGGHATWATASSSSPKACTTPTASSSPTPAPRMRSATRSSAASRPVVANMVREAHGYKYHWAVPDYLQRASRHVASKVDVQQAYAMGKAAVELAVSGHDAVMPTIVRKKSKPYKWVVGHVALSEVANVEKKLPRDYITEDGFGITEKCRAYLEPLIAGEDYPPYKNGLPDYVTIKGVAVKKKLNTEFKP